MNLVSAVFGELDQVLETIKMRTPPPPPPWECPPPSYPQCKHLS